MTRELRIVCCLPVDTAELERLCPDVELPKPTDLYIRDICEHCKQSIWISPRQAATIELDTYFRACGAIQFQPLLVLCYLCAIKHQTILGVELPVTELGGGYPREGRVME
jgi:hypothetical protein